MKPRLPDSVLYYVVPVGHYPLGDHPHFRKPFIGKKHLVVLVDSEDAVRSASSAYLRDLSEPAPAKAGGAFYAAVKLLHQPEG